MPLGTRLSRPPTQTKSAAALLAWVVVICAAIGLGGAWITVPAANRTLYLWGYCVPYPGVTGTVCTDYLSTFLANGVWIGETIVLALQAVSLVLSFIGAIVASVAGCLSQPKGALVTSIVFQVLYFIFAIAAWAYMISGSNGVVTGNIASWSYGFALAIVGTFLSLVVIGLSAMGLKSAPPAGAYGAGAAGYNAYGAQQPTTYAQEPGNPVGGQAMQKA